MHLVYVKFFQLQGGIGLFDDSTDVTDEETTSTTEHMHPTTTTHDHVHPTDGHDGHGMQVHVSTAQIGIYY